MKRGHPCQIRFWNCGYPGSERWKVDRISHLSIETVFSCKVENGRAFTESELRDELKAAFEAAADWAAAVNNWDAPTFEAWYDQHMKDQ